MPKFNKQLIVTLLLALFLTQSCISLTSKSATFDEVQYFGIGKYIMQHQKWDVMGAILHPPLTYYLGSLPLLFAKEDPQLWEYGDVKRDLDFLGAPDIYRGQELLSLPENKDDRLLISSRLLTALVSLLLGYYVYRFSRELFGEASGVLSLFFFSFCPNMLAFSGISVPDMPLTVFSFISIYYLWLSLKRDARKYTMLAGLFLGLALLCKFTALLLLPLDVCIFTLFMLKEKRNVAAKGTTVLCIAVLLLFGGYSFNMTPFVQGNLYRLSQAETGQSTFLMGQYSVHGWWYYYPLAFLMKTPISLLTVFSLALALLCKSWKDNWQALLFLLAPVVAIMFFFCAAPYSIALRYILPIYPFIFVIAGSLARQGKRIRYFTGLMAVWYVGASLYVAPHYLAYFNEAVGGPGNGYKYLVDGNLDWGQDLKGLKKFMDKNGIKRISLSYFGADSPQRYGIEYDWLPSHYLLNPAKERPVQIHSDQLLAISATNLQGLYLDDRNQFKWLLQSQPIAKIGYSIFVYDLGGRGKYTN
ncbi:MAG: hypothetical protein CXR31_10625 [Geobacter sp.]|nr:MAG: hypothetical protein CXR31_10625 [Geobacter sp.]